MVLLFFIKHVEISCKGIQYLGLYIYGKYSINTELNLIFPHLMQVTLLIRRDKLDITVLLMEQIF